MSSSLYRLGRWAFRRRARVAIAWVLLIVVAAGSAVLLGKGTNNTFSIPGTESGNALDQLSRTFPQVSGTSAMFVVVAPDGEKVTDPAVKTPIEDAVTALGKVEHVAAVADPFGKVGGAVSDDGSAAVITVQIDGGSASYADQVRADLRDELPTLQAALPSGSEAALGGDLFTHNVPSVSITEGIGLLVALLVLLITFGSFIAAGTADPHRAARRRVVDARSCSRRRRSPRSPRPRRCSG